ADRAAEPLRRGDPGLARRLDRCDDGEEPGGPPGELRRARCGAARGSLNGGLPSAARSRESGSLAMLFSNPDYPLFLIAVFFLYALARWGTPRVAWTRVVMAVLVGGVTLSVVALRVGLLGDPLVPVFLVYALVAVALTGAVTRWAWARIALLVLL